MFAPFARQAIYNRKEEIIGYELLYRSSILNKAPAGNGDRTTLELFHRLLQTGGGIEQAADGKLALVNYFQGHFFSQAETLFPLFKQRRLRLQRYRTVGGRLRAQNRLRVR